MAVIEALILFLIVIVGTYVGSLWREYARTRGKQLATKADL